MGLNNDEVANCLSTIFPEDATEIMMYIDDLYIESEPNKRNIDFKVTSDPDKGIFKVETFTKFLCIIIDDDTNDKYCGVSFNNNFDSTEECLNFLRRFRALYNVIK